jgi:hypothetical protein
MFYGAPGRYRVIVFVLQDLPFSQSLKNVSRAEALDWLVNGMNVLPTELSQQPFRGGHCTALVYEFESDGSKIRSVNSQLTGREHLSKAGLLPTLETTE